MKLRGPTREEIGQTVVVVRHALRGLARSRLPQMAAALSYRTIFGMVPAIVVGLVVLRAFATEEDVGAILERGLSFAGISQIVLEEDEEGVPAEPPEEPPEALPEEPRQGPAPDDEEAALPAPTGAEGGRGGDQEGDQEGDRGGEEGGGQGESAGVDRPSDAGPEADASSTSAERLDEWIQQRVRVIGSLNFKTIGIVGIALLVYAALSMLVEIERAFNQIYRAQAGRSWTRRVVQYWAVLTLGSVVIVASFALGEWFRGQVSSVAEAQGLTNLQVVLTAAGFLTTVIISMVLLVFLYRTMPNTHVHMRTAMAGAFVAAVLWEAGKWGFTRYLEYSAGLERLYGQMALVPLFLLWIYLTWLIVLFGLQVSYGLQSFSTWREEIEEGEEGAALVDPLAVVSVVVAITRAFARGRSLRVEGVASETGLREGVCRRMLQALAAAGVVHRVTDDPEEEPGYALARPAEEIRAEDLVELGQRMVSEPVHEATRAFYDELQARTRQLVAGRTVASIVGGRTTQTPEPSDDTTAGDEGGDAAAGGGDSG